MYQNFLENSSDLRLLLSQFLSDLYENLSTDSLRSAQQYQRPHATRSEHLGARYGLLKKNFSKKRHFRHLKLSISQQKKFSGQNGSREKFLESLEEAVCKFSAKSRGSFRRSGSDCPNRLKLSVVSIRLFGSGKGPYPALEVLSKSMD